jgi:8-oxo-dGTP pyrophosphatase MutT (NUDIX family)
MPDYIANIRTRVGSERILVPSTACVLLDEEGRILLQHRVDNGLWGCPGGIMEIGETVEESARRELLEETGLAAGPLRLIGIYSGPDYFATYPNGDMTAVVQVVFLCRDYSGEPLHDHEGLDLRFFDLDDLPEITSHHARPVLDVREFLAGTGQIPVVR